MGYSVMVDAKEPWCCETPCQHQDCAAIRARVNAPCRICGEPVAPGQTYYDESDFGDTVLVHSLCLYDEVEVEEILVSRGKD